MKSIKINSDLWKRVEEHAAKAGYSSGVEFVEHVIEKGIAGSALVAQHRALAHTGINEKSESKRQVRILRKILNCLGVAVFKQNEIIFGQIADDRAMPVPHSRGHIH